ncbi:MAG: ankyrin repeat domain-containing protein [Luteolibacter sp.]
MKPILLASVLSLSIASAQTQEPLTRDLLRDGLYAEEVTNDPKAAAKLYEQILARFEEQRPLAANALYRLAEVRLKEEKKDEAIALYQRVLSLFPDATPQASLARTRLTALGVKPIESSTPAQVEDPEMVELHRLEKLAVSSPDLLQRDATFTQSLKAGWSRPIIFALDHESGKNGGIASIVLPKAARDGHLQIVQAVIDHGIDTKGETAADALINACEAGHLQIITALLKAGVDPNGKIHDSPPIGKTPLLEAIENQRSAAVQLLISSGVDVNLIPQRPTKANDSWSSGSALAEALTFGNEETIKLLLDHAADVNQQDLRDGSTPLWIAAGQPNAAAMVKQLLELGADPSLAATISGPKTGRSAIPAVEQALYSGGPESLKLIVAALKKKTPSWSPALPTGIFIFPSPAPYNSKPRLPEPECLKLLLEAGATPTAEALQRAACMSTNLGIPLITEYVSILIDHGAQPSTAWQLDNFSGAATVEIRKKLQQHFSYPRWAASSSIVLMDTEGYGKILAESRNPDDVPSTLEYLFLKIGIPFDPSFDKRFAQLALLRRSEGKLAEQTLIDMAGDKPFPTLKWGDILEVRESPIDQSISSEWPSDIRKAMEKRLPAPTDNQISPPKIALPQVAPR